MMRPRRWPRCHRCHTTRNLPERHPLPAQGSQDGGVCSARSPIPCPGGSGRSCHPRPGPPHPGRCQSGRGGEQAAPRPPQGTGEKGTNDFKCNRIKDGARRKGPPAGVISGGSAAALPGPGPAPTEPGRAPQAPLAAPGAPRPAVQSGEGGGQPRPPSPPPGWGTGPGPGAALPAASPSPQGRPRQALPPLCHRGPAHRPAPAPPPPLYRRRPRRSAHAAAILFTSRPRPAPPRSRRCPRRASHLPGDRRALPLAATPAPPPHGRPLIGCGGSTRGRSRRCGLSLPVGSPLFQPAHPLWRAEVRCDRSRELSVTGRGGAAGGGAAEGKGRRAKGKRLPWRRGAGPVPAGACRALPCRERSAALPESAPPALGLLRTLG